MNGDKTTVEEGQLREGIYLNCKEIAENLMWPGIKGQDFAYELGQDGMLIRKRDRKIVDDYGSILGSLAFVRGGTERLDATFRLVRCVMALSNYFQLGHYGADGRGKLIENMTSEASLEQNSSFRLLQNLNQLVARLVIEYVRTGDERYFFGIEAARMHDGIALLPDADPLKALEKLTGTMVSRMLGGKGDNRMGIDSDAVVPGVRRLDATEPMVRAVGKPRVQVQRDPTQPANANTGRQGGGGQSRRIA